MKPKLRVAMDPKTGAGVRVLIRAVTAAFLLVLVLYAAAPAWGAGVGGRVTDSKGEPAQGASVYLDGTAMGVLTDASGHYFIANIRAGDYLVIVSMIGAEPVRREMTVPAGSDTLAIDFTLNRVPVNLQEIVVTAARVQQNLQTVPVAVSAITAEKIGDLSIRDRTDVSGLSPNSIIADTGSHMTDFVSIRGIVPATPFEATSLFYYDGVPIYGYGLNPMYLNDVDRIEIVRGPQGMLYGRNSLAGVVNIVSQKPSDRTRLSVGMEYGNYDASKVSLGVSAPLVRHRLFLRASVYDANRDGYYTNTYLDKNAGWSKGRGGTLDLRFFPSESFSAEIFANNEQIEESIWPFATDPAAAMEDPYRFATDVDSKIHKHNSIASLKLRYKGAGIDLLSTTAYQNTSGMNWLYDADFSPLDLIGLLSNTPYRGWSQEVRCQFPARPSRLRWMAGAFYSNDLEDQDFSAILGEMWARANHVPIWPIYQATTGDLTTQGLAGFAQGTYTLFERLEFTSGARIERQTIEIDNETRYLYNGEPAPPPFDGVSRRKQTKDFDFVTPRFALSYRLDETDMVYASASRGTHGGDFNSTDKPIAYYGPEFAWNYEVGWKSSFLENTLRLNANAFYIDWRQQQVLTVGDLSSPLQTITNAGRTTSKGLEMEVNAVPLAGLTLSGNLGLLEAKFEEFEFHETKDGIDVVYDYAGNDLQFTPRFTTAISAKYLMPARLLGRDLKAIVAADYQYIDPYYMSHMNLYRSAARQLVGGRVGISGRTAEVYLWAKNLLDRRYVISAYEYRGGEQAYLGPPRRIGVTVAYRY